MARYSAASLRTAIQELAVESADVPLTDWTELAAADVSELENVARGLIRNLTVRN